MNVSRSVRNAPLLFVCLALAIAIRPRVVLGQTPGSSQSTPPAQSGQLPPKEQPGVVVPGKTEQGEDKRILGVLPNYRTAEKSAQAHPLTARQKFGIAVKDSFDYPLMFVSAGYAGLYQLENTHPEFGQGAAGYFHRLGTSYADQVIGNMLAEGFMPMLLHEDPRYFRQAEGSKKSRAVYAVSRIFVTRTDSGRTSFNYSEIVGNGIAAGIGLSYYPDSRTAGGYLQNWGTQLATDAASQLLKEFWPDFKRWRYARHHPDEQTHP